MLYVNCADYKARLALDRMPVHWPHAGCQSIGKVEELSPVSHKFPLTGFVSLGAVILPRGCSDAPIGSCGVWMGRFSFALAWGC